MTRPPLAAALLMSAIIAPAASAQGFRDVEIVSTRVGPGVYMLVGQGGNIGACVGDDGVFLIDDQFAPLTGKITAAIAEISDGPIRFVINTHWHADHTGGNENLGSTGSIIVAHENVRRRLSTDQFIAAFGREVKALPPAALPVITFEDSVTFHLNGETIRVFHVDAAHTDGDSIIHFAKADVLHMGDVFFNGTYPFIDVSSGGGIDGMIAAVDRVLPLVSETTRIIPGHGPLADAAALRRYRSMLATVRDRVRPMVDAGRPRDDVIAARPTRDLDDAWGGGFMQPDVWVGIVYDGMKKSH